MDEWLIQMLHPKRDHFSKPAMGLNQNKGLAVPLKSHLFFSSAVLNVMVMMILVISYLLDLCK